MLTALRVNVTVLEPLRRPVPLARFAAAVRRFTAPKISGTTCQEHREQEQREAHHRGDHCEDDPGRGTKKLFLRGSDCWWRVQGSPPWVAALYPAPWHSCWNQYKSCGESHCV
jgi:hypothetical protein